MAAPHGATGGSAILPGAMAGIRAYLGVARASFLTLPVTLVLCGTGAAVWSGSFRPLRVVLALTGLVALHMAVNILNEVSDFKRGIDLETKRTPFSGGSGTLPMGALSVREATVFGVVCAGVGLAIGVYFLAVIGWPLVPLVAVGAICVLGYTDFLARSGLGEVAAGFGLGSLPVLGTALVQTGHVAPAAVAASVPAFFMTFNLLLLNEFPDEEADRRGGRRNLVLLLGRRWAGRIYAVAALAVPLAIVMAVVLHALPWAALVAVVPSLLVVRSSRWALRGAVGEVPLPALGGNVAWNLATNATLGVALIVAAVVSS